MRLFGRFFSKNQDTKMNEVFREKLLSSKRRKALTLTIVGIIFLFSLSVTVNQSNTGNESSTTSIFKSDEEVANDKIEKYIDNNREIANLLVKKNRGKALEETHDNTIYFEETILKDKYINENYDTDELKTYLMDPLDKSISGVIDAMSTYGKDSESTHDMMYTAGNYLSSKMDDAEEEEYVYK